ncbi:20316_t:CDS:1, partial [Entrophospora sp. SA101]
MPQEMEPVRALAFETGILEQINKLGINLNERVVDDTYNTNDMGF